MSPFSPKPKMKSREQPSRREEESVRESYTITGSDDEHPPTDEEELSELGEEQVEEVMPIRGADEEEDNDDDDDDDDDDEEAEEADGESGEEEEGEEGSGDDDGSDEDQEDQGEERVALGAGWGRKKMGFYGGGEVEDDSEDESLSEDDEGRAEKLEHSEVLRLQRQQAKALMADDFGEIPAAESRMKGKQAATSSSTLGGDLELPYGLGGSSGSGMLVEKLERDISSLSEDEKMRLLEVEAPELVTLLDDFKTTIAEVRERLEPLLAEVRSRQLPTSSGVALLQLKLQLLLSYCTNIAFYLLLKANGRPVRDHPVINSLLRHRVLIDRLAPLDKKMRYRVQKLLQMANEGVATDGDMQGEELRLKPNPDALLNEHAAAEADEEALEGGRSGVYRPPRLAAVPYEEERGAGRRERQKERALQRASTSRLVRELREEFSSAPREIHADDFGCGASADSQAVAKLRHEEAEVRAYEEANFTRLAMSKEQKRELRRRQAAVARGDELTAFDDDFAHVYNLSQRGKPTDETRERDIALRQYMASLEQRSKKARPGAGGDVAPPVQTRESREERRREKRMATARKRGEMGNGFGEGDSDEYGGSDGGGADAPVGNADYQEAVAAARAKRQRKTAEAEARTAAQHAELDSARRELEGADTAGDDDKRKADRQILKNRGLTRERKKIDRNPRAKNREKYRRAVIKRKGQVREVKTQEAAYGGERSGINQNVTHSRRFV